MATAPILFAERQRFTQLLIWGLLLAVDLLFVIGCIQQLIYDKPFGTKPAPDAVLIILTAMVFGLTYLFISMELTIILTETGITYQFSPFHRQPRQIPWDEVSVCYLRTYAPIREYGGWGPRTYLGNKAYTMSGTYGLQLKLINGEFILLGTNRPVQLRHTLEELSQELACIRFPEQSQKHG